VETPVVDTRSADSRQVAQTMDTREAGRAVDQATVAVAPVVRQAAWSPENAPDVVGHEPILSTAGAFLNVLPISGG
jgi:hypothetical protein